MLNKIAASSMFKNARPIHPNVADEAAELVDHLEQSGIDFDPPGPIESSEDLDAWTAETRGAVAAKQPSTRDIIAEPGFAERFEKAFEASLTYVLANSSDTQKREATSKQLGMIGGFNAEFQAGGVTLVQPDPKDYRSAQAWLDAMQGFGIEPLDITKQELQQPAPSTIKPKSPTGPTGSARIINLHGVTAESESEPQPADDTPSPTVSATKPKRRQDPQARPDEDDNKPAPIVSQLVPNPRLAEELLAGMHIKTERGSDGAIVYTGRSPGMFGKEVSFREAPEGGFTTSSNTAETARAMIAQATLKGWSSLRFSGSAEFMQHCFIEACRVGMRVDNFQPLDADMRALKKLGIKPPAWAIAAHEIGANKPRNAVTQSHSEPGL